MTQIDKTKPVMVTGANGYVASWLVKKLLDDGITVHAAVRDPNNEKKINITEELVRKNILKPEGVLIIEHSKQTDLSQNDSFVKSKTYGGNMFSFFQHFTS